MCHWCMSCEVDMTIVKGSMYEEMTIAVHAQGFQCPCVPKHARTRETLCICTEFINSTEVGECKCKRYNKTEV